jgi:serine phosphatase RsbU (regulator of sigma subunit)
MPELAIQSSGGARRRVDLTKPVLSIGRSRESDVFLPDQWLSRHHAEVRLRDQGCYLADLGSKNGTLLNGLRLAGEQRLRHGDVITLGEHVLTYLAEEAVAAADDDAEPEPAGTQVFSVAALSEEATREVKEPADLARQNRLLSTLNKAGRTLLHHQPMPELFETILDLLFEAVSAERGAILLLEGEASTPVVKASKSRLGEPISHVSRSIARRAIERRDVLLVPNMMEDAAFRGQDSVLSSGIRSALCAPLWFTEAGAPDQVIGLVYLDTREWAHAFDQEDATVLAALSNVAAAKIETARLLEESLEKRRMEREMELAAEIQRSLLPSRAPQVPGFSLSGSNQPCLTVGGDYFDFGTGPEGLRLALGDVSGKGTGAALIMAVLRATVRAHWHVLDTADATTRINRTLCENIPTGKYVTFFLARLDPDSGHLRYVNAGHNPPLLVRADGSHEFLAEGGMVLGLIPEADYVEGQVELFPGDTLVVFSDGVTETWNVADVEFGEAGLLALAREARGLTAAEIESHLLAGLERFAGGAKATDDRTLIVLKREAAA